MELSNCLESLADHAKARGADTAKNPDGAAAWTEIHRTLALIANMCNGNKSEEKPPATPGVAPKK